MFGDIHLWWTRESPRAHVAKFYGRLQLIRSVVSVPFGHHFSTFKTTLLANDHWRGFRTRNAHMVHIVNLNPNENGVYILVEVSFYFQLLRECHCWWTSVFPRAYVAKFNGRLRLMRSDLRASQLRVKIDWNCNFVGFITPSLSVQLVSATVWASLFNFLSTLFG